MRSIFGIEDYRTVGADISKCENNEASGVVCLQTNVDLLAIEISKRRYGIPGKQNCPIFRALSPRKVFRTRASGCSARISASHPLLHGQSYIL